MALNSSSIGDQSNIDSRSISATKLGWEWTQRTPSGVEVTDLHNSYRFVFTFRMPLWITYSINDYCKPNYLRAVHQTNGISLHVDKWWRGVEVVGRWGRGILLMSLWRGGGVQSWNFLFEGRRETTIEQNGMIFQWGWAWYANVNLFARWKEIPSVSIQWTKWETIGLRFYNKNCLNRFKICYSMCSGQRLRLEIYWTS